MNHGGKRTGAGRPLKSNIEQTETVSFRVLKFAEPEIKQFFSGLTAVERTKLLIELIEKKAPV